MEKDEAVVRLVMQVDFLLNSLERSNRLAEYEMEVDDIKRLLLKLEKDYGIVSSSPRH